MRHSLKSKMIISYLAVALATVLVVTVVIQLTSGQFMMNLVVDQQTAMLKETVQTYYSENGTMDGFFEYYIRTSRPDTGPAPVQPDVSNDIPNPSNAGPNDAPNIPNNAPNNMPNNNTKDRDIRGLHGLVDREYRALIPTSGFSVGDFVPASQLQRVIPVEVDGETVAWILPDTKFQFKLNEEEQLFLQRTSLAVGLAALVGILIAVIMGFMLAGGLLKPIRNLSKASQALAHGELQQEVPVNSQDELGQLTTIFNQMSIDLIKADQQRKRLTADITHDLSTPLQIISGYIEMLGEGEVTLTPQRIDIIKTEIGHLRRLVDDLGTLTQVEAGGLEIHFQPINPAELMERIYHTYQPIAAREGVDLLLDVPKIVPSILADEGRMLQILKNLVDNALRHTPQGGQVRLTVAVNERIQLQVSDSGTGIASEDLMYVFDRFYRADKAREANTGKMGLGLAICKALMIAQGGVITADSAGKGQGTTMSISFRPVPQGYVQHIIE